MQKTAVKKFKVYKTANKTKQDKMDDNIIHKTVKKNNSFKL